MGDEAAHHPFLNSLPPHVRRGRQMHPLRAPEEPSAAQQLREHAGRLQEETVDVAGRWGHASLAAIRRVRSKKMGLTMGDAREFLLAYCACFLAVSAFIA